MSESKNYVNEYGDIILPSDIESQKYIKFIHNNYEIDNDEESIDDMLNDYIIKYKIKRDNERKVKI